MAFRFSLSANKAQIGSKARAEKEAKERDEEEARKRVLAEFQDEHGDDDDTGATTASKAQKSEERERDPGVFVPQGAKRHFAGKPRSSKSGPGTLDEEPSIAGVPAPRFGSRWDPQAQNRGPQLGNRQEEDVFHSIIAKASNLPPNMDEKSVEELFADYKSLKVVKVEKIPPAGPHRQQRGGRPSATMKVTFDQGANSRELDEAMNKMSDKKYLGRGYYLHLDRYRGNLQGQEPQKEPFGARWVTPDTTTNRFAPTAELSGNSGRPQQPPRDERPKLVVTAYPPPDLPTLRLIHMTIESVLEGGMEFEALLMEQPDVQKDERFAWLYDNTHPLNRYYRFRMYQLMTGDTSTNVEIYPGYGEWQGAPPIPNEFAYSLETLTDDVTELDPEAEDDGPRRQKTADPYPGMVDTGNGWMSMKARAFLIHLLASLPTTPVRNIDVAAVTQFAISNASTGMDEIIDHVITNIFVPHALSPANPHFNPARDTSDPSFQRDKREATVNALRIVSDICFLSNRVSGRAYKYRDAIGAQIIDRKVFEYLETLPKVLQMGRATEDKFRKDVNFVIEVWQNERMFSPEIMEHIDNAFNWRAQQKEKETLERKRIEKRKRAVVEHADLKSVTPGTSQIHDGVDEDMHERNEPADNGDVDMMESAPPSNPEVPVEKFRPHANTADADMNRLERNGRADVELQSDSRMEDVQTQQPQSSAPYQNAGGALLMQTTTPSAAKPGQIPPPNPSSPAMVEIPGETPAARARRMRPKAEDMFASDED